MTPAWQPAAVSLVADLRTVFQDRLDSVVAYGPQLEGQTEAPLTCLALVTDLTIADLEACARLAAHWQRRRVATPLVLTRDEFLRSLDAFPLEYGEIIRAHSRVHGDDPFTGVAIAREDLRRAVETQAKSHLLHLREGFIESGGKPRAIAELVAASAPAFTALLRHVAWLQGGTAHAERVQATRDGARVAGVPEPIVGQMLALEQRASMPTSDPARLMPEYLAAVEQLARTVDGWRC
jgi:hypothetical protein